MANASLSSQIMDCCLVELQIKQNTYDDIKLLVMYDLCCDAILGQDFFRRYSSVKITFGGPKTALNICDLAVIDIQYPSLIIGLQAANQRYSYEDKNHSSRNNQNAKRRNNRIK